MTAIDGMAGTLEPLDALKPVLRSIDGLRNGRALYLLVATIAVAGLLFTLPGASSSTLLPVFTTAFALFVAFYGTNATGILLLDQARGQPVREIGAALQGALAVGHRLLLVALAVGAVAALGLALLFALLWLTQPWPGAGAWPSTLFGLIVPVAITALAAALVAFAGAVVPLAAPAVWAGESAGQVLVLVRDALRRHGGALLLLAAAASLLAGAVGALVTSSMVAAARVFTAIAALAGTELPLQALLAGLSGRGLASLGGPVAPHVAAAVVGAGAVFALVLALPTLVYLRAGCAIYLSVREAMR